MLTDLILCTALEVNAVSRLCTTLWFGDPYLWYHSRYAEGSSVWLNLSVLNNNVCLKSLINHTFVYLTFMLFVLYFLELTYFTLLVC